MRLCAIWHVAILFLAAQLLPSGQVWAGSFRFTPIRLDLMPGMKTGSIVLTNESSGSRVIQLETAEWTQLNGDNQYTPTNDLIATPPIFTLAPNASQTVRIAFRKKPDAEVEKTYRLFFQEAPPPPTPGQQAVEMLLKVGIPIYAEPMAPADRIPLGWRASMQDGQVLVRLDNPRNRHIVVQKIRIVAADSGKTLVESQEAAGVLSGQWFEWKLKMQGQPASAVKGVATVEGEKGDYEFAVSQ